MLAIQLLVITTILSLTFCSMRVGMIPGKLETTLRYASYLMALMAIAAAFNL